MADSFFSDFIAQASGAVTDIANAGGSVIDAIGGNAKKASQLTNSGPVPYWQQPAFLLGGGVVLVVVVYLFTRKR